MTDDLDQAMGGRGGPCVFASVPASDIFDFRALRFLRFGWWRLRRSILVLHKAHGVGVIDALAPAHGPSALNLCASSGFGLPAST